MNSLTLRAVGRSPRGYPQAKGFVISGGAAPIHEALGVQLFAEREVPDRLGQRSDDGHAETPRMSYLFGEYSVTDTDWRV